MTRLRGLLCLAAVTLVAACEGLMPPAQEKPAPDLAPRPSARSEALADYYSGVQADLIARGLLRQDGGGPDTPVTPDMLARNFENIVFYDEYARGGGLRRSNGRAGGLRRWDVPVRVGVEFGASVPAAMRSADTATVKDYVARLASASGHSISVTAARRANFHVLVMGADDRAEMLARVREIIPGASHATLSLFRHTPREIHCLVVAFSDETNTNAYRTAIAMVRAEHPDLLRKSCYHEEIAQGLGLANDSPEARPSIFNDDDEFALLTSHDEALLKMLYNPALSIGMSLDAARPTIKTLARSLAGRYY
ncbi:DUF2927 domain-containing protein [Shimia aestuarii]|uniref:DUF2927 domain-containing protein n=1 Tax=Shimia aestuarii TaxID=254406 RepID=UPI001FB30D17|nr:DUF2927 domain-containing protein [Shimia aestuarii]